MGTQGYFPTVLTPWMVTGLDDVTGDGKADVFWRNPATGQMYLWTLNGLTVATQGFLPSVIGANWQPVNR